MTYPAPPWAVVRPLSEALPEPVEATFTVQTTPNLLAVWPDGRAEDGEPILRQKITHEAGEGGAAPQTAHDAGAVWVAIQAFWISMEPNDTDRRLHEVRCGFALGEIHLSDVRSRVPTWLRYGDGEERLRRALDLLVRAGRIQRVSRSRLRFESKIPKSEHYGAGRRKVSLYQIHRTSFRPRRPDDPAEVMVDETEDSTLRVLREWFTTGEWVPDAVEETLLFIDGPLRRLALSMDQKSLRILARQWFGGQARLYETDAERDVVVRAMKAGLWERREVAQSVEAYRRMKALEPEIQIAESHQIGDSMSRPTFTPEPCPMGRFLLFVLTPGAGWGLAHAMLHDDDLDDLLEQVPPSTPEEDVHWHVYDLDTGYVCANHDNVADHCGTREYGETPLSELAALSDAEGYPPRRVGPNLVAFPREDAWGAYCIAYFDNLPINAAGFETEAQLLDTTTSMITTETGQKSLIVSLAQVNAFKARLTEWVLLQQARGQIPNDDVEAVLSALTSSGPVLPEGWQDMSAEEIDAHTKQRVAALAQEAVGDES